MLYRPKKKRGRKKRSAGGLATGFIRCWSFLVGACHPALASRSLGRSPLARCPKPVMITSPIWAFTSTGRGCTYCFVGGRRALLFRDNVIGAGIRLEKSLVQGVTIVIGVDGGRLRTRKRKKGRKKESGHHGFDAEWREPKVLVIYEVDEKGRKKKAGYQRYDATMENCDAFALIAGHLRTIGADKAARWPSGDGALRSGSESKSCAKRLGSTSANSSRLWTSTTPRNVFTISLPRLSPGRKASGRSGSETPPNCCTAARSTTSSLCAPSN